MLVDILRGTPIWVYALFAWLLWNGLAQLRDREISQRRIWIMPTIFIAWGLSSLAGHGDEWFGLWSWMLAALIGLPAGAYLGPAPQIDVLRRRVRMASSVIPLIRNLSLFGAHYALQVAMVIQPAQHASLLRWDVAVSGFGAGYFLGWAMRFVRLQRDTVAAVAAQRDG